MMLPSYSTEREKDAKTIVLGSTENGIKRHTVLKTVLRLIFANVFIVSTSRSNATSRKKVSRSQFMTVNISS
jgi:uncharacterized protein Veg